MRSTAPATSTNTWSFPRAKYQFHPGQRKVVFFLPPPLLPSMTMCCLIPPPCHCIGINLTNDSIQLNPLHEKHPGVLMQLLILPLFCVKSILLFCWSVTNTVLKWTLDVQSSDHSSHSAVLLRVPFWALLLLQLAWVKPPRRGYFSV